MTDNKWYQFSGFMEACVFKMDHPDCPFQQYWEMDQYERLEHLTQIKELQAEIMMNKCRGIRFECKPAIVVNKKTHPIKTSIEAHDQSHLCRVK